MNKKKVAEDKPLQVIGEIGQHLNTVYDLIFEDYSSKEFTEALRQKKHERGGILSYRLLLFDAVEQAKNILERLKMLQDRMTKEANDDKGRNENPKH